MSKRIAPRLWPTVVAASTTVFTRIVESVRRASADRRGVAAVEFAIILPLMLLLYIGATDITRAVIASRNVNILSRTISDLVSQENTGAPIPSSELSLAFAASSAVMTPFDTTSLTMTVSAVDIAADPNTKQCCQYLVRWTYTQGGTLRTCTDKSKNPPAPLLTPVDSSVPPSATNIPKAIGDGNNAAGFGYSTGQTSYVIVADVTYTYSPIFPSFYSYGASTRKTTFMVPRSVSNPITISTTATSFPAAMTAGASGQNGTICYQ